MDVHDNLVREWYKRRPFGKQTLEKSVHLQMCLRAYEEGTTVELFEQEVAKRNGSGAPYLLGNQAYTAPPSHWIKPAQ